MMTRHPRNVRRNMSYVSYSRPYRNDLLSGGAPRRWSLKTNTAVLLLRMSQIDHAGQIAYSVFIRNYYFSD